MTAFKRILGALTAASLATSALAQSGDLRRATPFLPLKDEPPAKLLVRQPLAEALARGVAIIPYETENFRILPVFGAAAAGVSPRVGHLHVSVDDLPWRWADAGDNGGVVVAGLAPGRHKVLIELVTPEHRVIAGQSVAFVVPGPSGPAHQAPVPVDSRWPSPR